MSSFSAGFVPRQDAAARALQQAVSSDPKGFAPADMKARAAGRVRPKSFSPEGAVAAPKGFSPADPAQDPTEGWDPFDPNAEPSGFVDPIDAARSAGFAEGVAHAVTLAREEAERNIALLQSVTHALQQAGRIDRDQLARRLREAVLTLVSKLVGDVGVSADLLIGRIEAACDLLVDSAEAATLRVHPADLPMIADKLPKTVSPIGDEAIERGGFVLESASTIVEEGPELWIEQLAQAIDRVAVPTC